MIRLLALCALFTAGAAPALAFDQASEAALATLKRGKPVPVAALADLMMGSELWCYNQQGSECAWSDIYLAIEDRAVSFEITNPWDASRDISFVSAGELRDGRFICETGFDWIPSTRAFTSADGGEIYGRDLHALKLEIAANTDTANAEACFDYLYEGSDAEAETVTLLQRQHLDGETDPALDATVTLHFNKATAASLGWY